MSKVLPVLVFFALLLALAYFSPIFKINAVEFTRTQQCVPPEEAANLLHSENIILLQTDKVTSKLQEKFPCAKSVKVNKIYPNRVTLDITADQTVAKIDGQELYLTTSGQIASNTSYQNLPTIFLPQIKEASSEGIISDKNVLFALNLLSLLVKSDFTAASLRFITVDQIAVYDQNGMVVVVSTKKDATVQIDSLQQVLASSKINPFKITKIDLRFNQPIINKT